MAKNEDLKLTIEEIKVKFKLTQSEIAQQLGLNQTYLSGIINGKYPLSRGLALKLSKLYQVSLTKQYTEEHLKKAKAIHDYLENEEIKSPIHAVPYEFVQALIEERKRHDEMNAEFLQQNAELIRQNGLLIRLLEEKEKTVVQEDASARCADASESGLAG